MSSNPGKLEDSAQKTPDRRDLKSEGDATPSSTRRLLMRGAMSSVPVMVTLVSGAALAQASAARRAVTITSETDAMEGSKAFGYEDKGPDGFDGNDVAYGFRQDSGPDDICIQDSPDPQEVKYRFKDNEVQFGDTVPDPASGKVAFITASSWTSLGPGTGGVCG